MECWENCCFFLQALMQHFLMTLSLRTLHPQLSDSFCFFTNCLLIKHPVHLKMYSWISWIQPSYALRCKTVFAYCLFFMTFFFLPPSGVWSVGGLEVTTGKVSLIEAVNGSTVLLPCNYHSCIGIKNLFFKWTFRNNGSEQAVWTTMHQHISRPILYWQIFPLLVILVM